ncbi:MAG: hypothetical protein MRY77_03225, partial [Rhodobacteraceae bacterium]|nr:hypothetical protein [Paracoccaceae bacterium]
MRVVELVTDLLVGHNPVGKSEFVDLISACNGVFAFESEPNGFCGNAIWFAEFNGGIGKGPVENDDVMVRFVPAPPQEAVSDPIGLQRIIAGAAVDRIAPARDMYQVIAFVSTEEGIVSSAIKRVIPLLTVGPTESAASGDVIIAGTTKDGGRMSVQLNPIISFQTRNPRIGSVGICQRIIAGRSDGRTEFTDKLGKGEAAIRKLKVFDTLNFNFPPVGCPGPSSMQENRSVCAGCCLHKSGYAKKIVERIAENSS